MKWIFNVTKWLTGALFVFSGLVKLNDPSGFAIKLNEYFDVFAEDVANKQDSIKLSVMYGPQEVFQQSFSLYASDSKKSIQLKLQVDSTSGAVSELKFGGLERSWQQDSLKNLPSKIIFKFTMPDNSVKSFESSSDSTEFASNNLELNQNIDVTTYVKSPGFWNYAFKEMKAYSLPLSVFFCALEVILGLAMLLGYQIKLTIIITGLLILFFTFLTGYSAMYNKVTDCGCFGDFLKLEPWQSFKKDVVLTIMVIIMMSGWKHNRPVFIKGIDHKIMAVLTVLTFGFGLFCYLYLPVWDFLPYKKGNNIKQIMEFIPQGQRATDSIQIKFVMKKGNDSVYSSTADFMSWTEKGYEFVRQDQKIIIEGYKSPIHDFAIYDLQSGEDLKDEWLNYKGYQLVYIMPFLNETYTANLNDLMNIVTWSKKNQIKIIGLSSASLEPTKEFLNKYPLNFEIYAADQKMLMTMARYNPTLYLFKGSTVIDKFSGRNLPDIPKLEKLTHLQ